MNPGDHPRAKRPRRGRLLGLAAGLLLLAFIVALWIRDLGVDAAARAAFPLADGRVEVSGIAAVVWIDRDAQGVPHIAAQNEHDAFFGLGFVHAQDRLAQMLWLVRTARGRTAEVVGPSGLPSDRLARLLSLGRIADEQFDRLDPATRTVLEAYAAGVNARIERIRAGHVAPPLATRGTPLPLETWRPSDSLAVAKLHAWGVAGSLEVSLVLSDLIERLGGFEARLFFPDGPGGQGPDGSLVTTGIRPADRRGMHSGWSPDPLRRAAGLWGRSIGSSAWVLGGAHSASGRPILVADAHLEPTAPAYYHVDHVRGGDLDVAGATIPGIPVVWTGHNRRVAWASTHAGAVTTDLYLETLHPGDPSRYHDGKQWRPLREQIETISVRDHDDEVMTIRSTVRGPLLREIGVDHPVPMSVAWVGTQIREVRSVASMLAVARARDSEALLAALADHGEPALAVVYADSEGNAGMQVAGWIPHRVLPSGLVPLPGRARWYEWEGRIPFEELPRKRLKDGKGWVVAADNRLSPADSAPRIEWLWRNGSRARRIGELLDLAVSAGPVDVRQMTALQFDVDVGRARSLVDEVLGLAGELSGLGAEAFELAVLLREWDGQATATSVGAAAFHVFLTDLTEALFAEKLGPDLLNRYLALAPADPGQAVYAVLRRAREAADANVGDRGEPVRAAVRKSLRETWLRLSFRLGANRRKWHWGRLHSLQFRAFGPPGGKITGGLGPIAYGGSADTINAAEYDATAPYRVRVASTFRFAVDLDAMDASLVALAPGQSEHPKHPHFRDGIARWLDGRPALLITSRILVEEGRVARLVLEPLDSDS